MSKGKKGAQEDTLREGSLKRGDLPTLRKPAPVQKDEQAEEEEALFDEPTAGARPSVMKTNPARDKKRPG